MKAKNSPPFPPKNMHDFSVRLISKIGRDERRAGIIGYLVNWKLEAESAPLMVYDKFVGGIYKECLIF